MKNKNFIIELIKTGKLLNLELGQNIDLIKSIIKESADVISLGDNLDLWSYGYGLELYIQNDELLKFSIKYDETTKSFNLPKSFSEKKLNNINFINSIDDLVGVLNKADIEWEINKKLCGDTELLLSCNNIVDICYDLENHYVYNISSRPIDWWVQENEYWKEKNNRQISKVGFANQQCFGKFDIQLFSNS